MAALPSFQLLVLLACVVVLPQRAAAQQAAAPLPDPFMVRDQGGSDKNLMTMRRLISQPLKVHVYDIPWFNQSTCIKSFACHFLERIRKSRYHVANPEEADYWWIPSQGTWTTQDELLRDYAYVRNTWPYWNRTVAANQTRHLIMFHYDQGAGTAAYSRPIKFPDPKVPDDVHPANPNRNVAFVMMNGMRDGADHNQTECLVCFIQGKDILLPKSPGVCGPLCGYDLKKLRESSLWAKNRALRHQDMVRQRNYLVFYGGKIGNTLETDFTGRGPFYHYYYNNLRYLFNRKTHDSETNLNFADAMPDSDWCYSPLGQMGGPSDRYSAAIMFACLPIMLSTVHVHNYSHALPLEEVLDWSEFGTVIDRALMKNLDDQLKCLDSRKVEMRQKLARVFRFFLYTSIYGSYVGENDQADAFEATIAVLKSRVQNNYGLSPKVRHRILTARDSYFPCRTETAVVTVKRP